MTYYIVYRTTNEINENIYIGCHKTNNLDDGYLGSGVLLIRAIKKYGYENFKKEIIFIFDNKDDMFSKERELVNEDFLKKEYVYNIKIGGSDGSKKGRVGPMTGRTHSEETKRKISIASKGRTHSEETKQRMSKNNYSKNDPEGQRQHASKVGRYKPKDEVRNKISDSLRRYYETHGQESFGRPKGTKGDFIWIYSVELKQSKMHNKKDEVPEGWLKGRRLKF